MKEVSFDYESLRVMMEQWCREGGWLHDDQELEDIIVRFKRTPWPKDQAEIEEKKFEVRVLGVRVRFRDTPDPDGIG